METGPNLHIHDSSNTKWSKDELIILFILWNHISDQPVRHKAGHLAHTVDKKHFFIFIYFFIFEIFVERFA